MDRAQAPIMGQMIAFLLIVALVVGVIVVGSWIEITFGEWALAVPILAVVALFGYVVIDDWRSESDSKGEQ